MIERIIAPRRAVDLFLASHPGPVVAVTLVSTGYAIDRHRGAMGTFLVAIAVLCGQLCIGWHNDALDADKDEIAGRTDKPIATGRLRQKTVRDAAIIAGLATIPMSLASGWLAGLLHLVAVGSGLSYNAHVRKTAFSFLPFAVSFSLLPFFIAMGAHGTPLPPWWAPTAAGALGVGAHLLNTLPDHGVDIAHATRGLPHRIGRTATLVIGAAVLFFGSVVLSFGPGHLGVFGITGIVVSGLLIIAALITAHDIRSRRPFQCSLVLAMVDVALLIIRSR